MNETEDLVSALLAIAIAAVMLVTRGLYMDQADSISFWSRSDRLG